MKESYIIKYNYKKSDGFWEIGATFDIELKLTKEMTEKDNHSKAELFFEDKMRYEKTTEYKVISIIYV